MRVAVVLLALFTLASCGLFSPETPASLPSCAGPSNGCSTQPPATAVHNPAPNVAGAVQCSGPPETEPGLCARMLALIEATYPDHVDDASRILIADACPPDVLCDRQFLYDAVAVVVPADRDVAKALLVRVYGHQGQALNVGLWSGPLPEHVTRLLQAQA